MIINKFTIYFYEYYIQQTKFQCSVQRMFFLKFLENEISAYNSYKGKCGNELFVILLVTTLETTLLEFTHVGLLYQL